MNDNQGVVYESGGVEMDDLQRMMSVATDYEHTVLADLALRCGLLWRCPECAWHNQEDWTECEGCGATRCLPTMTIAEMIAELRKRFGPDPMVLHDLGEAR